MLLMLRGTTFCMFKRTTPCKYKLFGKIEYIKGIMSGHKRLSEDSPAARKLEINLRAGLCDI